MNDNFPFNYFVNLDNNDVFQEVGQEQQLNDNEVSGTYTDDSDLDDLNNIFLDHLKEHISPHKYKAFFGQGFRLVSFEENGLFFKTPTSHLQNLIKSHYGAIIEKAILNIWGQSYPYEIICENEEAKTIIEDQEKSKNVKNSSFFLNLNDMDETTEDLKDVVESQYISHVNENQKSLFDVTKKFANFIVGPSNNMAYASCFAVAKNPGKTYPTLYIHSKSGLGKTHLLHAVANYINDNTPQLKVHLTSAQYFLQEMIESIKQQNMEAFRIRYTEKLDVLIIDDIHELKNKKGTQDAFFHIFNDLYSKGKQLIFTSDKTPKEIDGIEERIKTRLSWGLVLDIQQPDLETRIAILKKKAQQEDIYLSEDVFHLIASCIKDNIRELEGSLIKLAAYSSIFQEDIDIEIARRELKLDERKEDREISIESIAKTTSQFYKVPLADLKSKSRLKDIATARHISMFLTYKLVKTNLSEIGRFYGGRDHTTVLHAINKIKKESISDSTLSQDLLSIENNL